MGFAYKWVSSFYNSDEKYGMVSCNIWAFLSTIIHAGNERVRILPMLAFLWGELCLALFAFLWGELFLLAVDEKGWLETCTRTQIHIWSTMIISDGVWLVKWFNSVLLVLLCTFKWATQITWKWSLQHAEMPWLSSVALLCSNTCFKSLQGKVHEQASKYF